MSGVHPAAVIDPSAELAEGVEVGPYAIVGAGVKLGAGTIIESHAVLEGPATFGRQNHVYPHVCIGQPPQDLKFAGGETRVEIGDRNHFREFTTVHRGTEGGGGVTRIGSDNLFQAYSHVAHDCQVGSHTVFSNCGTLAGHVTVGDYARVGAFSAVHQFCRVGRNAYIGGFSVVTMDALPYAITVGQKPTCMGMNRIGLERGGFAAEEIQALERAFRVLLRSKKNTTQALETLRAEHSGSEHVGHLIEFIESSQRGFVRGGRRGARGAA
ncbi:MAG: acyl-ACP--UDP-N-acetylglucosamine O-acyltransferase [Acidobacteria bacterium]|nr:MAG: acyl-ACP--UDP-N-acetylglucosamine O-acyltransferase [Acidobacteriota bacterium]